MSRDNNIEQKFSNINEIQKFIVDIHSYLKNQIQLHSYENTSILNESESNCLELFERCEKILFSNDLFSPKFLSTNFVKPIATTAVPVQLINKSSIIPIIEGVYLEMNGNDKFKKPNECSINRIINENSQDELNYNSDVLLSNHNYSNLIDKGEGVYEEPNQEYCKNENLENYKKRNYNQQQQYQSFIECTEEKNDKPPNIEFKKITKNSIKNKDYNIKEETKNIYDIPLPLSSSASSSLSSQQLCSTMSQITTVPSKQSSSSSSLKKSLDFQKKFKDIHNKLSNQLSSPVAIGGGNLKHNISNVYSDQQSQKNNTKESTTICNDSKNIKSETISPVKSWLWNRLSKSSSSSLTSSSKSNKIRCKKKDKKHLNQVKDESNSIETTYSTVNNDVTSEMIEKVKGHRVHTIISQLQANGKLPMITKSLQNPTYSHQDYSEIYNDCNYEPIMMLKG